ncbi:hypothetical protein H6G65_09215, partial [Microcystis elabens FACHB-917]|nr:hypothetical protein [Microcystis elabens FACHB-917]
MANYYFGAPTSGNGDGSSGNPWSQAGFNAASFTASTDSLNVASGFTVSITAARANGTSITGDGNLVVTAIDQTPAADLSLITVAGTRIGDVAANTVFTGNFGTLTIAVGGGALLTSNSSILTGVSINGAGSVAVSDTVSVAQGSNLGASISTSLAFSAGITDTLANLASGGIRTAALDAVLADDSDVVITISDASGTQQAADLSAVGSGTTGTVTVSNAQTVSGTTAEVTAALVTDATEVVVAAASTA